MQFIKLVTCGKVIMKDGLSSTSRRTATTSVSQSITNNTGRPQAIQQKQDNRDRAEKLDTKKNIMETDEMQDNEFPRSESNVNVDVIDENNKPRSDQGQGDVNMAESKPPDM